MLWWASRRTPLALLFEDGRWLIQSLPVVPVVPVASFLVICREVFIGRVISSGTIGRHILVRRDILRLELLNFLQVINRSVICSGRSVICRGVVDYPLRWFRDVIFVYHWQSGVVELGVILVGHFVLHILVVLHLDG